MAEDVGSPLSELSGLGNMSAVAQDICLGTREQGIDVLGLVAIIIFYLAVLAVTSLQTQLLMTGENVHFSLFLGWNLGELENTESGTKSRTGRL